MAINIHKILGHIAITLLFFGTTFGLNAQDLQLVWADEFEGSELDKSIWQSESGPSNDNVHFYTDRVQNISVADGKLRIIALRESYQGYAYTSAHIRTEGLKGWRYGRMEASIKLPSSPGFVPAFWMLPIDQLYGWWPHSGEIDIMEHPTNEITRIYGTAHTQYYNLFDGAEPPQGGTLDVPDAESAFHLYAVEWTPDRIDFFVDDQKYYTFENDAVSSSTWPFNQPFYIILNLAVGGGWVGTPTANSIFPAIMEVDYVRVYQDPVDMEIQGPDFVTYLTPGSIYSLGEIKDAVYQWTVPGGAAITSGQNSHQIAVDWGLFGGEVKAEMTSGGTKTDYSFPVRVSSNLIKNGSFEKGVKYWSKATGYPSKATISLHEEEAYDGTHSIFSAVSDPAGNTWDVQLSQAGFMLEPSSTYRASLMAKSGSSPNPVSMAVIDLGDFSLAGNISFTPGEEWLGKDFSFTPSRTMTAALNVDMGGHTGSYYLDDFYLTTEKLAGMNLVRNPDFFDGTEGWKLTSLSGATAEAAVVDGEYRVSISNGGESNWDLHVGQAGLPLENGTIYRVSFDAYADAPRQVTALVGKNEEPWTVYSHEDPVDLSATRQTYSFNFTMDHPTDLQSRLGFDIGGEATNIYFDNVLFRKTEATGTLYKQSGTAALSGTSIRTQINSSESVMCFSFTLPDASRVSIRILDLGGRILETLEAGFLPQGKHSLQWYFRNLPAGIYLYQFHADDSVKTGKLLLK